MRPCGGCSKMIEGNNPPLDVETREVHRCRWEIKNDLAANIELALMRSGRGISTTALAHKLAEILMRLEDLER